MQPKTIDHVAFWVADRQAVAAVLRSRLGLREIDRQETFTLLGVDTPLAAGIARERG
jgi:catechol 2,3-dioxygenase-like lactoylglutathione lyase family enzyme